MGETRRAAARAAAADFAGRLRWADGLLLLYVAAVAREYFWSVGSSPFAWPLTILTAACVVCFYVAARGRREAAPRQFWLAVVLPLAALYLARAALPDTSFDVLNYRLFHAERAMAGPLLAPGDWFPTPSPFNPAPDIATGISRRLLGYRLGTIVNLLAIVWAARIVERFLRPYVAGNWRRAACVLLVALSEHVLFEINEYMIDVLAVPLLLEAIRLAARDREGARSGGDEATRSRGEAGATFRRDEDATFGRGGGASFRRDVLSAAFLVGLASAFKLTSATLALPLALLFAPRLLAELRAAPPRAAATVALAAAVFALPLAPHAAYLYAQTGNPVFPLYNAIFESPYWTPANYRDPRWGPFGFWETITWPLTSVAHPARLSELNVYSGRLTLGTIAALAGLACFRRDRAVLSLSVVFLLDALAWSASTGYVRYALHLEFVAGLLLVCLSALVARGAARESFGLRRALAALPLAALAAQASVAFVYVSRTEWGGRPTVFDERRSHLREARRHALRDRSLRRLLPERERAIFDRVEVWIVSGDKTAGVQVMLRPDAPAIGVRHGEYFATEESRRSFAAAIARAAGRRMYSLSLTPELEVTKRYIESRGLKVVGETPVSISYYSAEATVLPMTLLEVRPANEP